MDPLLLLLAVVFAFAGPVAIWLVMTLQARVERLEREVERLRHAAPLPPAVYPARTSVTSTRAESDTASVVARAAGGPTVERSHDAATREPLPAATSVTVSSAADAAPQSTVPPSNAALSAPASPSASPALSASAAPVAPATTVAARASQPPVSDLPSFPSGKKQPDAVSEALTGQRWLAWSGAALLIIGLGLLAKVAWDRGWLGQLVPPPVRVALVASAGAALLGWGWRQAHKQATPISQALAGTGLAGLYLAVVAARAPALGLVPEPLLGATGAFALLGVVAALGLVVAVTIRAPGVALLALFGGELALLVAPDSGARYGLLIHQILLEAGVLGAAAWCGWRWVSLITAGSVGIVTVLWWCDRGPGPAPDYLSLLCVSLLAAPMLLGPGLRPWLARRVQPTWILGLAVAALVWYLTQSIWLLHDAAPYALAVESVLLAAGGVALWRAGRTRVPEDTPTQAIALVVAALALALALFAALPADAQAVAWLAEGVALLTLPRWIGVAMPLALRRSGVAVLVLGLLKALLALFAPLHDDTWLSAPTVTLGLAAGLLAVVAWRCGLAAARDGLDRGIGGTALVLWPLLLGAALSRLIAEQAPGQLHLAWVLDAAGWAVAAVGALAMAKPAADPVGRAAIAAPLVITAVCAFIAMTTRTAGGLPLLNLPLLISGGALAALALTGRAASRTLEFERALWGTLAWLLASADLYTWCQATISDASLAKSAALASVTILWAVIGITLLGLGLRYDAKTLRVISLFAFAGAAVKLLLFDLAGHDAGIRVAAFIGLGVFFLAGAHLYQRFGRRLAVAPANGVVVENPATR